MGTSVLSNALLLFDGLNLSGISNVVALDFGAEAKDDTTLADDTRSNCGGLKTAGLSAEGFFDATADADMFADLGVDGKIITIAKSPTAGEVAYSLVGVAGEFSPMGAQVGDLLEYALNVMSRGDLERGQVLVYDASETTSSISSGLEAGAAATQITAILHVFSASGSSPTLDVSIESDVDNTFSTPATQLSFTQATGQTAERVVAVGAVSDTWWRVVATIGGTTPDFGFAVILIVE